MPNTGLRVGEGWSSCAIIHDEAVRSSGVLLSREAEDR